MSKDEVSLMSRVESLGKITVVTLGGLHLLGFWVTNVHLLDLGISDFGLLQSRSVVVGLMFIFYLSLFVFPIVATIFALTWTLNLETLSKIPKLATFLSVVMVVLAMALAVPVAGSLIGYTYPSGMDWGGVDQWRTDIDGLMTPVAQYLRAYNYPQIWSWLGISATSVVAICVWQARSLWQRAGLSGYVSRDVRERLAPLDNIVTQALEPVEAEADGQGIPDTPDGPVALDGPESSDVSMLEFLRTVRSSEEFQQLDSETKDALTFHMDTVEMLEKHSLRNHHVINTIFVAYKVFRRDWVRTVVISMALGSPLAISGYAAHAYPNIEFALGGGQPQVARVQVALENDESLATLGLANEPRPSEEFSDLVAIWYASGDFFYLTPLREGKGAGPPLALSRARVRAISLRSERTWIEDGTKITGLANGASTLGLFAAARRLQSRTRSLGRARSAP